jgi:two-component system, NtrC family, response regulator AtoC
VSGTVLVVDDDAAVSAIFARLLGQDGIEALAARSGAEALTLLETRAVDVVVSDIRMPGMDGMQLLAAVQARWPELPVLMLTAHGSVPLAVEAMKAGAADFLLKPVDRAELLHAVKKALARASRVEPAAAPAGGGAVVAASSAMQEALALAKKAAKSQATVLVRGESGTGKEVVARMIHDESARAAGPFVKVHCAAFPESLIESELFGYEKGAFTGAVTRKPGRVELAQGGTLFLDEIGDVPLAVQVKLLRLIQERELERLGGTETVHADVRFVAATHRDLEAMIAGGEFRQDLFYRLNVVPVWLPPLRERPEDIEPLARRFAEAAARAHVRPALELDAGAMDCLRRQRWPGNVRELVNFVERLVVLADTARVGADDVERELARGRMPSLAAAEGSLDERVRTSEREAIRDALQRAGGNRTLAARLLGVSRRTLYNKLEELGLG